MEIIQREKNWLLDSSVFYKLVIDVSYLSRTRKLRLIGLSARSIKKKKKKRIYWNICNIGGIIGTTRSRNRFLADNFYFHSIKFSSTKFYYKNIINQNEHPSKRISVTLLLLLSSRIFPKGKNPRGIIAWNEARSRMETERKTRWGREEGDRFVISFSSSRGFRLGLLMNSD